MTITLKEVKHDLRTGCWCGLAAVSTLTGKPTSKVRDAIREYRTEPRKAGCWGRPASPVTGTSWGEVTYALEQLSGKRGGLARSRVHYEGHRTLAAWLRERPASWRTKTFLINAGRHWIVVSGNTFCDSFTKKPVTIGKAPHRRRRVLEWAEVIRKA